MLNRLSKYGFMRNKLWLIIAALGPGIITANADNDASGVLQYSQAGASYRYEMIWVLVLTTFSLIVLQEICARMGAVTGRGLADLIREEYGPKITLFAMVTLLVANYATTVSEFAGILAALNVFFRNHFITRCILMPLTGLGVFLLVTRGSYHKVEKFLLGASLIYLVYFVSMILAHPNWKDVAHSTFLPNFHKVGNLKDYVMMVIMVIGTTITPWGQFYIQSTVRDKGVKPADYWLLRADIYFGGFFTNFIGAAIIICCGATIFGVNISNPGQAALSLQPALGVFAMGIFAFGLFNASCFGAITVPLSTAYAFTEALGWESGVGRRIKDAPLFIGIFTFLLVAAVVTVLAFPNALTALIVLPNIVGGILLPIILVLMLLIVNKRRIMGNFVNSTAFNIIAWITVAVVVMLSIVLLVTTLFPKLAG